MLLTAFPEEYDGSITARVYAGIMATMDTAAWRQYLAETFEKKYVIKDTNYSGFDSVPQWKDGTTLPLDEAEKINDLTMTMLFYGMGFKVTRKHLEYGLSSIIQGWADSLSMSVGHTYGTISVAMLDAAFTTTIASLGTKTLCSTTHLTAGVSTRSNRGAGAALTPANLDVLRQRGANWINYRGINTPVLLKGPGVKLIVPTELERTASKIINSTNETGTGNNDINTYKNGASIVEEVRLTSTTAYFLQAPGHGMTINHGLAPRPIRYMEDCGNLVHGIEFDCVTGIKRPDGIFGDAGV